VQCELSVQSRGDRIAGTAERDMDRIVSALEHVAAMRLDSAAQDHLVPQEGDRGRPTVLMDQPGAALDISKKKANGPRRQVRHGSVT